MREYLSYRDQFEQVVLGQAVCGRSAEKPALYARDPELSRFAASLFRLICSLDPTRGHSNGDYDRGSTRKTTSLQTRQEIESALTCAMAHTSETQTSQILVVLMWCREQPPKARLADDLLDAVRHNVTALHL